MVAHRTALVTGAASGIGRATVELMIQRGHRVVAFDLPEADWSWVADDVASGVVVTAGGDVADDAANEAAVGAALAAFGALDVAVLNAGIAGGPPFEAAGALDRLDRMLAVNVRGVASGIRHAAAAMRTHGRSPAIVATASTSGLGGDPHNWAYNASKAAVINLVRAAALDYGAAGIRVNAVAPGPTETGMTRRLNEVPHLHESMARRVALQRWGRADELAEAILFLSSPAASFITGVTLPVDGGLSATAGHFDLPTISATATNS